MSCSSHLPPRNPRQNRELMLGSISKKAKEDNGLHKEHHRFPSQGYFVKEETFWLDDLFINSKTSSNDISLRRAESDPVALLEASSPFHSPIFLGSEGIAFSTTEGSETDNDFEASFYGPNSPRQKNALTSSESLTVSALLDNVSENTYPHLSKDFPAGSRIAYPDSIVDSSSDHIPKKAARRHSRQRSRARKLQYISELEKTVHAYEVMKAELACSVASVFQQCAIISVENKKLKQQLLSLQQRKMIKEGQYQYLKNEVERLRMLYAHLIFSITKKIQTSELGPVPEPVGRRWI